MSGYRTVTVRSWPSRDPVKLQVPVTRVSDNFLASVVFLYETEDAAKAGVGAGGGSGFVLGVRYQWHRQYRRWHYYLVTNKHVVNKGGLVARLNVGFAQTATWDTQTDKAWEKHPTADLAICAFDPPEEWNFACIDSGSLLTAQQVRDWGIGVGDDVFVAARLLGFEGQLRNTPILHTGTISMMPGDPAPNPETKQGERGYLIEVHSRGGFSGSPVFGWISPKQVQLGGPPRGDLGEVGYLLGVMWAHLDEKRPIRAKDGSLIKTADGLPTGAYVDFPRGLAGVVPAAALQPLLDLGRFVNKRREDEEAWADAHASEGTQITPDYADEPEPTLDQTADPLRKLADPAVKDEADEVHRDHG